MSNLLVDSWIIQGFIYEQLADNDTGLILTAKEEGTALNGKKSATVLKLIKSQWPQ